MKIKKGYILKKLGTGHVVLTVGEAGKQFNGMIRLNPAGVFLWKQLETGADEDAIVKAMLDYYAELDEATARADLRDFLRSIAFAVEE